MNKPTDMNAVYLVLKTANNLFGKAPAALDDAEHKRVHSLVRKQSELEACVLGSAEARDVVVPEATLAQALDEIGGRYASEEDFLEDLARNDLSMAIIRSALERELKVDGVLEKIGSRAVPVSDIDVELYYLYHPEQFMRPEIRRARHILVTINENFPENTRVASQTKIEAIAARLAKDPKRFEEQALKHSECPTAMHGGLLGEVRKGQLFPEVDGCLQALEPGQIGGPVESELGWHLVLCEAITPGDRLTLNEVREVLRSTLLERRKNIFQKAWLKQLQTRESTGLS